MEVMSPRPPQEFLLGSTGACTYTPKSTIMNPFASTDDVAAGNPFLATTAATAPPSPNPFEQLPPGADPFDLFQHFTSAPASPAGTAAIYAQFDSDDDGGVKEEEEDDVGFQPRVSYSMSKPMVITTVHVPFDWEEKPGKPKAEFASMATTTVEAVEMDDDDADFDSGVLLDKASAQAQELTTADELFDEGKIRPLKPPPRLLESGSVGSTPRSARSVSVMWSPRVRGRLTGLGSADANFDPFAAALVKAANTPSYPIGAAGAKHDAGGVASASSPIVPGAARSLHSTPPATDNGGSRKKWRHRDLLRFRRATKDRAGDNISKDPVFKYASVQVQQLATPVKTASAGPTAVNGGDASVGKQKKRSKKAAPAEGGGLPMPIPQRLNLMGCVRLRPGLHRLAKGFHGHSAHLGGRGAARSAT